MNKVGIYCSSNRPHLWGDLIKTLSNNSVDWNLCIAGPNPPIEPLPGNVKFIQTNVKPAQCFFIASYNVTGNYMMNTPDDIRFSPGSLDDLIKLSDSRMTISSARFNLCGEKMDHYIFSDKRVPKTNGKTRSIVIKFPLTVCSMMNRETFDCVGQFDKYFVALYWPEDIAFELVSRGGKIIISEYSTIMDIRASKVCMSHLSCDYSHLMDMWFDGDIVRSNRKISVDPLVYNDTVLTVSQGKKDPKLTGRAAKRFAKVVSLWT